jgi:hypothetical protein
MTSRLTSRSPTLDAFAATLSATKKLNMNALAGQWRRKPSGDQAQLAASAFFVGAQTINPIGPAVAKPAPSPYRRVPDQNSLPAPSAARDFRRSEGKNASFLLAIVGNPGRDRLP